MDKITVFIKFPAAAKLNVMPGVVADLIKDYLRDDGSESWQFPGTRIYNGYGLAGRVECKPYEYIETLINAMQLPFEIVGAQDFDYRTETIIDPETGEEIIREIGRLYKPMSRQLYWDFLPDINVGTVENPIWERPPTHEVGPIVVAGASPMELA